MRFIQLVGLFAVVLTYVAIGGFHYQWRPAAGGGSRLSMNFELSFPRPLWKTALNAPSVGALLQNVASTEPPLRAAAPPEPNDPRLAGLSRAF